MDSELKKLLINALLTVIIYGLGSGLALRILKRL